MNRQTAEKLILAGNAPDDMYVEGDLGISHKAITHLPNGLHCTGKLTIKSCKNLDQLPSNLKARSLIIDQCLHLTSLPDDMQISDELSVGGTRGIKQLPDNLQVHTLHVNLSSLERLPDDLRLKSLTVNNGIHLTHLPENLQLDTLSLSQVHNMKKLPASLRVKRLTIESTINPIACPENLEVETLIIQGYDHADQILDAIHASRNLTLWGCRRLTQLPQRLNLETLNLKSCIVLPDLPDDLHVSKSLTIQSCHEITNLPNIQQLEDLILMNCPKLTRLPEKLKITKNLKIEKTGITTLPDDMSMLFEDHHPPNLNIKKTDNKRLPSWRSGMFKRRELYLDGLTELVKIPFTIPKITSLMLLNCTSLTALPDDLKSVTHLYLKGCSSLERLPNQLNVNDFHLEDCSSLIELPESLGKLYQRVVLKGCTSLKRLPNNLAVRQSLDLRGCVSLETLPENFTGTQTLFLTGCSNLTHLPNTITHGYLFLSDCTKLTELPDLVQDSPQKPIRIEIDGSNEALIENTPLAILEKFKIFWKSNNISSGVEVPAKFLKNRQAMTAQDIINIENVEVRRILIELMGMATFIKQVGAKPYQTDQYGTLYCVELPDDEPLMLVRVKDPSTKREYFLSVPPTIKTAHAAVAWTFNLRPDMYNPISES